MGNYSEARDRLFKKFDRMNPGAKLNVVKEAKGRADLYIAICKEYIDDNNYDYEFSSDYAIFRRLYHKI